MRIAQTSQIVEMTVPAAFGFVAVLVSAPPPDTIRWMALAWAPIAAWAFVRKCGDDSRILGISYRRGRPYRHVDVAGQVALLVLTAALTIPALSA